MIDSGFPVYLNIISYFLIFVRDKQALFPNKKVINEIIVFLIVYSFEGDVEVAAREIFVINSFLFVIVLRKHTGLTFL